jgi:hypothetical protein
LTVFKNKVFIIFITPLLSGCLSLNTLQSGKSLGKDNLEISAAGTLGKYSQNSLLDEEGDFDSAPVFGLRGRIGVSNKIDLGFHFDQTSLIGTNFKYQFIGDSGSTFASSLGLDAGFNFGSALFGNFTHYVSIPLYTSYHPSDNIAIYLTPRYLYVSKYIFSQHPNGDPAGPKGNRNKMGSSYGIIVGKNNKIVLEVSNYESKFYKPSQFTIGYLYTFRIK